MNEGQICGLQFCCRVRRVNIHWFFSEGQACILCLVQSEHIACRLIAHAFGNLLKLTLH